MLFVAVVSYFLIARLEFGGERKGPVWNLSLSLSLSLEVQPELVERSSIEVWGSKCRW